MKTFKTEQEARDYSVINPSETVEFKDYHYSGNLYEHSFFVDGLKHGEFKSYNDDGQLDEHSFYVNGILHGEYKSYWENGQLDEHSFFVDGVRNTCMVRLAKDDRTPDETELVKATVGDNYFK